MQPIVRWFLDTSELAGLGFGAFVQKILPGRKTLAQENRLRNIRELAIDSVGCTMGEGAHFEAQVMTDGLRQLRETIQSTDDEIRKTCRRFPEC